MTEIVFNILAPTDFSVTAWNALQYVQKLYADVKCNFYLLHVSPPSHNPVLHAEISEKGPLRHRQISPARAQLMVAVKKAKNAAKNANHRYYGIHEQGFFLESVRKQYQLQHIDLIAMGTKGVTGLRQKIIGSNTGDVITKVACNILAVPRHASPKKPLEIAFPTDYNIFYSQPILNAITELMKTGKGNLRVLHVLPDSKELNPHQLQNRDYLEDFLGESFRDRSTFHMLRRDSVLDGIQCFVDSRDTDMIFMVAKNLNFLQQVLFDSLVEKISFRTSVPFFVVHE